MATIADLVVLVRANTAQFQAGMAKVQATTATAGGGIGKFGGMAQVGFAVAGAAVVKFAADAVNAASAQTEALNKANVVFEDQAGVITRFADTSAKSFGISKTAALDAASGFGAMLQTAGLTEQASANLSVSLTKLAADMASFNNVDPSEMLERLRSGLAGEAEPLRRFGVFISEARVKAEAYRSGIAAVGSELTEAQKVQARYNVIMADTAKQQGDFARTSDSLANQQRVLAAEFEDLQAQLGQALVPAVLGATSALNDLLTILLAVTGAADVSGEEVARSAAGWVEWTTNLGRGLPIFGQFLGGVSDTAGALKHLGEETEQTAREHGSYFGAAQTHIEADRGIAKASREAADAIRDQRVAVLAATNSYLGMLDSASSLKDAQNELERLTRRGAEGTQRYDRAVAEVVLQQAAYEEGLMQLAEEMDAADASGKEIRDTIRELGDKANLSEGQVQDLLNRLNALDGMNVQATIALDIERYYSNLPNGRQDGDAPSRLIARTEPWMRGGTTVNVNVENAFGLDDLDRKVSESLGRTLRRSMAT